MARLIDRLEARGVVERRLDPRDRRVRRLHLTAQAAPLLMIIHAYRNDLDTLLASGIKSEDAKRVIAALLKMKSNLLEEKRDSAEAG